MEVAMRAFAIVAILLALTAGRALGQWRVGLEIATARYGGSAHDTSNGGGVPTFRPGDATMIGVRLERIMGRLGTALRVSMGTPGLAAYGDGLTVVDKSSGESIEVATFVAVRVGGIGPSGAIRAEIGPALHLWNFGDDLRSRIGALGALAYEWPVAGRFSGAIRLEGTVSGSWFEEGDLPPEYDLRVTWRYGVTLGLRYRL
jgi:hypothetical protein